jgi:predicted PurR-regulated permease PerM
MSVTPNAPSSPPVDRRVDLLAAYSWRLLVIGAAALAAFWLARLLSPVLIPAVVALFLTRLLTPISDRLRRYVRPGLAALAALLALLGVLVGISVLIVPPIADEIASLDETVTLALDDIEDWLVSDSPFDVSREAIDRLRTRTAERFDNFVRDSRGQVVDGVTLVAEAIAGLFLALLFTFFLLRDGPRFATWLHERLAPTRREPARRAATRGWFILGRYLRGAATLGIVESVAIGIALFASGGGLVAPVMILTFIAAFVPILGAVIAGVTAVLVGLVTGGVTTAAIVAVVALAVQQLDNDILAPWIYGRALALHPVVILVSVVAGGALFGIPGTLLAVPVVAVAINVGKELRTPGSADVPIEAGPPHR